MGVKEANEPLEVLLFWFGEIFEVREGRVNLLESPLSHAAREPGNKFSVSALKFWLVTNQAQKGCFIDLLSIAVRGCFGVKL